tara:strand:+ start:1033 stop:1560 length:528 start_codon:yes stop_codon:yes gene_type:complete
MTGSVYCIGEARGGVVKIGFTAGDPAVRLTALQTGSPRPLRILGLMPGGLQDEARLHAEFANLAVSGEWFRDEGFCISNRFPDEIPNLRPGRRAKSPPKDAPKLAQWLYSNRVKSGDFAAYVGISHAYMSEIAKGKKTPGLSLALRIQQATGGEVSMTDWFAPEEPLSPLLDPRP